MAATAAATSCSAVIDVGVAASAEGLVEVFPAPIRSMSSLSEPRSESSTRPSSYTCSHSKEVWLVQFVEFSEE